MREISEIAGLPVSPEGLQKKKGVKEMSLGLEENLRVP